MQILIYVMLHSVRVCWSKFPINKIHMMTLEWNRQEITSDGGRAREINKNKRFRERERAIGGDCVCLKCVCVYSELFSVYI